MKRPVIPEPPHRGGCLCGRVRYRLDTRPLGINVCHCADCRKLTGAANLLMLLAASSSFVHESGELARYRKTADSGRQLDIVRCAECGVRMWYEPLSSPEYVFIAAGTLDDSDRAIPATHIWTEGARLGTQFESDAVCMEGQPPTRQVLMDAFARLYP